VERVLSRRCRLVASITAAKVTSSSRGRQPNASPFARDIAGPESRTEGNCDFAEVGMTGMPDDFVTAQRERLGTVKNGPTDFDTRSAQRATGSLAALMRDFPFRGD
jgi:hypothetical protein